MKRIVIGNTLRLLFYSIVAFSIFNVCIWTIDTIVYGAILLNNDITYTLRRKAMIENIQRDGNDNDDSDRRTDYDSVKQANTIIDNRSVETTSIDNAYRNTIQKWSSESNSSYPLFDQSIGCKIGQGSRTLLLDNRIQRFDGMMDLFPKYVRCAIDLY